MEWLGRPKSRFSVCLQERTWARPCFPGKASSRPSALLQEIAEPDMTELHSDTYAQALDAADPLRGLRDEFLIPQHDGREQAYFCGNSLGLQPRTARAHVEEVLDKWAHEAVERSEERRVGKEWGSTFRSRR